MANLRRVAIIPARGGSKRIPKKNIKPFCGKPMIAWSIEAALLSGCFDEIIVSTDDTEIAVLAREEGARVPFVRPAELADDFATTGAVVRHAVQWLKEHDQDPDYACCIYATAPFLSAGDLQRGWELITQSDADYAFSVTSYDFPIQRAVRITERGRIQMFHPEQFLTRSQDLDAALHDAGQFYWGKASAWLDEKMIFSEGALPVYIPRSRVQDIDTQEDWDRAEWIFRAMKATQQNGEQ